MRAMLQLAPNELATPLSHRPSGDQVNCWKKPFRSHLRTTCLVATSMNVMPLIDKHASCLPSGLQLAQGYSPSAPNTCGWVPSLLASTNSPCVP